MIHLASPRLAGLSLTTAVFAAACLAGSGARADDLAEAAGHYAIQPSSVIGFSVAQVGGGGIVGRFPDFSGSFDLDAASLAQAHVDFTLDPASISTGQARIDDFLRSSAVFDAKDYPKVEFHSTSVTRTGTDSARIDGNVTAHGVTYKASFDAKLRDKTGKSLKFDVTGTVFRLPYGMGIGVPIYSNSVVFNMVLDAKRG